MAKKSKQDDRYFAIIDSALSVCRNYKPKFGKRAKAGLTFDEFQTLYQSDPFYTWFGLDSPLIYAAHKAAGGMTSVYRQIGISCERLFRQILQDTLGLNDEQAKWSYTVPAPSGRQRTLSLDGRISLDDISNAKRADRVRQWLHDAAASVNVAKPVIRSLQGSVFEVRQGYKSKDAKRQNADIGNAANAYANSDDFIDYAGKPARQQLDAELYGLNALCRLYRTRDGWVFLGVFTEREWQALCQTVPRSDLAADPRFASAEARSEHDGALAEELADLFATQDADDWERTLVPAGVGCVRADGPPPGEFWADDEHVRANGFAPLAEHARYGTLRRHGPVVTLSETPGRYGPGSLAGDHTDAILREFGYDEDSIAALRADAIVWSEQP